jgi:DNA-binding transcriptional LysR family regulator
MELKHLQQILEICRSGSFSAAARRLNISQPALSKSIALLESQLGVMMFDRREGAAHPTPYGLLVAERAEAILPTARSIAHDIKQILDGETGKLRIGVSGTTRIRPLPKVVSYVTREYPHLSVETRNEIPPVLTREVRAGRYDIVFCASEATEPNDDLIRVIVFDEPQILVARWDHPLANRLFLSPEELLEFPVATFGIYPNLRQWAGNLSPPAKKNLEALATSESELIKRQVLETQYLGYGARFIYKRELAEGTFVELPTAGLPKFECWMLTTPTRWRSPIIKAIAEVAKSPAS